MGRKGPRPYLGCRIWRLGGGKSLTKMSKKLISFRGEGDCIDYGMMLIYVVSFMSFLGLCGPSLA